MLQKIIQTIYLFLMLYGVQIAGMTTMEEFRTIEVFQRKGETIFEIEKTIEESLDEVFQDFGNLIQFGEFVEARDSVEAYCNHLTEKFKQHRNEIGHSTTDLTQLLEILKKKLQQFIKRFDNNFVPIKIGCDETIQIVGLLLSMGALLSSIMTFDSGILLLAVTMALILGVHTGVFLGLSSSCVVMTAIYKPNLFFNFMLLISFTCLMGVAKINNKNNEKNKQCAEIQRIILNFQRTLEKMIAEGASGNE